MFQTTNQIWWIPSLPLPASLPEAPAMARSARRSRNVRRRYQTAWFYGGFTSTYFNHGESRKVSESFWIVVSESQIVSESAFDHVESLSQQISGVTAEKWKHWKHPAEAQEERNHQNQQRPKWQVFEECALRQQDWCVCCQCCLSHHQCHDIGATDNGQPLPKWTRFCNIWMAQNEHNGGPRLARFIHFKGFMHQQYKMHLAGITLDLPWAETAIKR